jgi:hypothetical protein
MFLIFLKYLKIYLFIWCFWFTIFKITTMLILNKEYKVNIFDFIMKLIFFFEGY